jgi:ring-1,2-phenylacetyl-CoA epoxidase subunit PaaA
MDLEKFVQYVHEENKVEPKDVMPDDYRKLLVRQISHAHSEIVECCRKLTGFQELLH